MSQISFENLAPQVSRQICKELQQLISDPPEGIKVILNEEDISDIQAIIDGPGKLKTKAILKNGAYLIPLNYYQLEHHMPVATFELRWFWVKTSPVVLLKAFFSLKSSIPMSHMLVKFVSTRSRKIGSLILALNTSFWYVVE